MKNRIIQLAQKYDVDLVGFGSAERFSPEDAIFKILPETQTVIALGVRVLRGAYRGVEEGTTFYQYTTMGVENIEETIMPLAMLNICNFLEDNGYYAMPQKWNQLIMQEETSTNPEVDYTDIFRGIRQEPQLDFRKTAVACGLGEIGLHGSVLTDEFGPFQRFCYILTDAQMDPTPITKSHLCDNCGECIKACPGRAITSTDGIDPWRCAVYYNGAGGRKNPFLPPDSFSEYSNRMDILFGTADFDQEGAQDILNHIYCYPPAKHSYKTCICGKACDRACYIHLEGKGLLTKSFVKPFRKGEDWTIPDETYMV